MAEQVPEPAREPRLAARVRRLQSQLSEAEATLHAIRHGDVDAVVITDRAGDSRVYTLETGDHPYRSLIEQIREGAVTLSQNGTILYSNRRLADMIGQPLERLIGQNLVARLNVEDPAALAAMLRDARGGAARGELTLRTADGAQLVVYLSLSALRREGETPILCGIVTDLTEHKTHLREMAAAVERTQQLATELANKHEQLRVTLLSIGDGVITTDMAGRIAWLNPVAERMTGWPAAEAAGRPLAEVFQICNEETRAPLGDPLAACIAANRPLTLARQALLMSRQGDEFGIEESAAPIRDAQGETLGVVLVFHDVTHQRRLTGEMTHRATHDLLTGLINRAEFEVRLQFALHKAHADLSRSALLFIDLDNFKLVNDACGHAAGDRLLQQMARMLGEPVRGSDTLARLGGDEFAIILEHCSPETALAVAQRICDRMEDFRFVHGVRRFAIGTSIGLVPIDAGWPTGAAVLQAGDSACYAAKAAGRNRVHLWAETDQSLRARQGETQMADRLAQALAQDRFVLFAQRISRLQDGADGGARAEVLLRMRQGDGSLAQPGVFLPAAERFHLLTHIDRWVLERAVQWLASTELAHVELLCVNLAGQSLAAPDFRDWAMAMLARAGPAVCRRLCLELAEISVIANLADAAGFMAQVQSLGVQVALDAFGGEAASFGYLKTMPVNFLKISGQFVRDLVSEPLAEVAVRSFSEAAAVMGMRTIAECVEAPAVLDKLRRMGIDYAQGFCLHRPAPIESLRSAAEREGG